MNVAAWLERAALLWPDRPALMTGIKVERTYRGFADAARSVATFLAGRGVRPGARVAVFSGNSTAYLEALYGIWHAGAVAVPVNAKLHPREAAYIVENAECALVFADADHRVPLEAALGPGGCPVAEFTAVTQAEGPARPAERGADDLAGRFYTSGTTGRPKGVMLSHGNLTAMALSYFVDVDQVETADAALYAAPISHGAGLYNFMHVMKGARHVIPASGGFDGDEIVDLAPRLGRVHMFAAPTMVKRLVAAARAKGYAGEGLKTIVYGGGPMYVADILEASEVLGDRFAQIYGQGESPMTITAMDKTLVADRTHPRWRERLASVGRAHSVMEVMVAGKDGERLEPGAVGEVLVRGPAVMRGYWRDDEATARTLRDGWLWTGDMGMLDEDGFLTLKDRSKDLIITGGTNVYPREVEEVLLAHDGVAEAAVIGVPDAEWGESIVAYLVAHAAEPPSPAALDAHFLAQIARFKRPKHYVFVDRLPKNNYGKVLKTDLRRQWDESRKEPAK